MTTRTTKEEKDVTKIGCWAAFWGDTRSAVAQLLRDEELDYLVSDYLAEITMALLARGAGEGPRGWASSPTRSRALQPLLAEIAERGIKVVTNAGALNPRGLRRRASRRRSRRPGLDAEGRRRSRATTCCRSSTSCAPPAPRTCSPARRCPRERAR